MSETTTLRPGLLVSLHTSIKGNVHYTRQDLEAAHMDDEGQARARWETTRIVSDPSEHDAAVKVRGRVRGLIVNVCSSSMFGLLCPNTREDELKAAVEQAREIADDFNGTATLTHVSVNVIYGRIAQDDVEAVRAIATELRELMDDMTEGLTKMDVKSVREACQKAKGMGQMLSQDAKGRLDFAIESARSTCRKIVKAGEAAAIQIDQATIAKIQYARTAFLDLDDEDRQVATPAPMTGRAVEMDVA
jgi:hypothetical protein